jgi:hypothetical protein
MFKEFPVKEEQRKLNRRDLSYYMPVAEVGSKQLVGIIVDISPGGFRLESPKPIPIDEVHNLHIDLTGGTGPLNSLVLTACSKWCNPDFIDPTSYIVGFEIMELSPEDALAYQRLFEEYTEQTKKSGYNRDLYPWR